MIERTLIFLTRLVTGVVAQGQGFHFEPPAQRIYYANHTSHMDTLLIWSLIPKSQRPDVHPAAAKDYWWASPFKRHIAEHIFHAVPVVRHRDKLDADPLHDLEAMLARGGSLIFFPEGTRGDGKKIQSFKSGLYHLAAKFPHVSLVPVYINNLNRVLPKGEFLPVPIICTVHFGPEFMLHSGETRSGFLSRAQSNLEALTP